MGRYSLADVHESIQAAAADSDGPLTVHAYRRWRRRQSEQIPSIATIYTGEAGRYETWRAACKAADVTPPTDEPNQNPDYSRADVQNALRIAAGEIDGPLTIRAYESWRKRQSASHPSRTVIFDPEIGRYDSWNDACAAAGVTPGQPGRWSNSNTA